MDCGNDTVTYFGNCTDGQAVNGSNLYYAGTASQASASSPIKLTHIRNAGHL